MMILGGFLLFIGQSFSLGGFSSNVWISLVFLMKGYDGMSKSKENEYDICIWLVYGLGILDLI